MVEVTKNRLKRGAVVIALAVLTVLFIALFVDAVFEQPRYEDYCGKGEYMDSPRAVKPYMEDDRLNCTDPRPEAVDKCYQSGGYPEWTWDDNGCQEFKECNMCQKGMEEDRKYASRNAFYLGAVLSLIALVAGLMWPIEFIGTGFMFGGITGLFYSTVRYFSEMDKWVRVVVMFAEICIVLFVTYMKLVGKDNGNGKKFKPMKSDRKKARFRSFDYKVPG